MSQVTEKRPSRLAVAYIYAKRAARWRRNSYPYISGDAFADLADYVHEPPRWRSFNKGPLESARVIFVRSENLQELLSEHGHNIQASVIVTGNSDHEFHSSLLNVPPSVKAIFLQNSFISDGVRFFSIPLGIENFRWGVNGNPKFMKDRGSITVSKPRILFGPLGKTHRTREIVTRDFDGNSKHWDFFRGRIKPQYFDTLAKEYTHVAAVRGNGVDTHRLWESLYRGVTPIVEKSAWWDSLSEIFPEVEIVDTWTRENVLEVLARSKPSTSFRRNPALWMPFWENKINKFLN
jgi:hypothetical protein